MPWAEPIKLWSKHRKFCSHRFLQQHLLVQLHTYVSLALNKDMKFNLEDPLEKRLAFDLCCGDPLCVKGVT